MGFKDSAARMLLSSGKARCWAVKLSQRTTQRNRSPASVSIGGQAYNVQSRSRPGAGSRGDAAHEDDAGMIAVAHQGRFRQQLIGRYKAQWLLKILGTTAYMTAFMVAYFFLVHHPAFAVVTVPATALDRLIGFQPWSLLPYASLWLYVSLVPMFLYGWRELLPYLGAITLLSFVGLGIFFFWPTAVPDPDVDWTRYPSVAFLKSVDAAGNACPSLHVAFAVLTALWMQRLLDRMGAPRTLQAVNVVWCLTILYSTLAIKQHVALDLYAGALLGAAIALPFLHFYPLFAEAAAEPESA